MNESAFLVLEFYGVLVTTFVLPVLIYIYMLKKRSISRYHVVVYGVVLVSLSALSAFFLSRLREMSLLSVSLTDEKLFASEISIALYIVPAIFAGIGINIISHVLIDHLQSAERRYAEAQIHSRQDTIPSLDIVS